jgi:hypothetical protein
MLEVCLLITEATALFQWGRLTVLIVVAAGVELDALSCRIRYIRYAHMCWIRCKYWRPHEIADPSASHRAAERIAIVGHNGAGNNPAAPTSGFSRPESGRVMVLGQRFMRRCRPKACAPCWVNWGKSCRTCTRLRLERSGK